MCASTVSRRRFPSQVDGLTIQNSASTLHRMHRLWTCKCCVEMEQREFLRRSRPSPPCPCRMPRSFFPPTPSSTWKVREYTNSRSGLNINPGFRVTLSSRPDPLYSLPFSLPYCSAGKYHVHITVPEKLHSLQAHLSQSPGTISVTSKVEGEGIDILSKQGDVHINKIRGEGRRRLKSEYEKRRTPREIVSGNKGRNRSGSKQLGYSFALPRNKAACLAYV